MNEFCTGVKILIDRMETHPEDFDEGKLDHSTLSYKHVPRFKYINRCLESVLKDSKDVAWGDWKYFTEEERKALIQAYTNMKRKKFDAEIMGMLMLEEEQHDRTLEQVEDRQVPSLGQQLFQQMKVQQMKEQHIRAQYERAFQAAQAQYPPVPTHQTATGFGDALNYASNSLVDYSSLGRALGDSFK